jgi:hypothetical protein
MDSGPATSPRASAMTGPLSFLELSSQPGTASHLGIPLLASRVMLSFRSITLPRCHAELVEA